jgi:hypothetical protein
LLREKAEDFDVLVEIGCMHGRALDWSLAHGKRYVGIDITPRYIKEVKKIYFAVNGANAPFTPY